jgi:hypothetical protein
VKTRQSKKSPTLKFRESSPNLTPAGRARYRELQKYLRERIEHARKMTPAEKKKAAAERELVEQTINESRRQARA